jgi:acyl carrier protein
MGLDTVELVIAIEDAFEIRIANADAAKLTTPAEVTDYLMSRLRTSSGAPCPSQAGFYRLRSVLMKEFGIPRQQILPDSSWCELFKSDIPNAWRKLGEVLAVDNFPRLERSKAFFVVAVFGIPTLVALPMLRAGIPFSLIIIAYAVLAIFANTLTLGMGRLVPARYRTVASLIPYVNCADSRLWTREDVLAKVIEIASQQLGIRVDEIRPDSHFVYDLGAD